VSPSLFCLLTSPPCNTYFSIWWYAAEQEGEARTEGRGEQSEKATTFESGKRGRPVTLCEHATPPTRRGLTSARQSARVRTGKLVGFSVFKMPFSLHHHHVSSFSYTRSGSVGPLTTIDFSPWQRDSWPPRRGGSRARTLCPLSISLTLPLGAGSPQPPCSSPGKHQSMVELLHVACRRNPLLFEADGADVSSHFPVFGKKAEQPAGEREWAKLGAPGEWISQEGQPQLGSPPRYWSSDFFMRAPAAPLICWLNNPSDTTRKAAKMSLSPPPSPSPPAVDPGRDFCGVAGWIGVGAHRGEPFALFDLLA